MSDILKDSRFSKYLNDPTYRQIPKHKRKVKIDKRFQSMFSDEKFKVKYTIDKRGRPINETSTENLRKYYDLEESDESTDGEKKEDESQVSEETSTEPGQFVKPLIEEDEKEIIDTEAFDNNKLVHGSLDIKTKKRLLNLDIDYARGEGVLLSDSSSDEESSEEEAESELEHEWGELDANADTTNESTKRIAICNMDWDNIKATDLMVLLSSFLPAGGILLSVTIYPSDYGIRRMKEEDVRGPIELTEENKDNEKEDGGNEEGSAYHMEKLRRYQLNRLKYFYAVAEFDSVSSADKVYGECDGTEYESSATKLDMRFVPDDVTFDQAAREVCTELPDLSKYKPRLFTTTALQQAKVELTWDTTNPNRAETIKGALDGKVDELDLKEYLASSSEDETAEEEPAELQPDSGTDDPIQKYKMILEDIERKEQKKQNKDMEMEITWGLGTKDKAEELIRKKMTQDDEDLTPFEKLLQKRKERKKQRKLKHTHKENDSERSDESSDDVPADVDMNDPYFAEEFNKPEFKKKKKKPEADGESDGDANRAELELLLDEDDGRRHFSLKKIQEAESATKKSKRRKKLKEQRASVDGFEMDLNDRRFAAVYESPLYSIDPSDPGYKPTSGMERLLREKLVRKGRAQ